jgi:hypothetical protein
MTPAVEQMHEYGSIRYIHRMLKGLPSGAAQLEPLRETWIARRQRGKEPEQPVGALVDRFLPSRPIGAQEVAIHVL